MPHTQRSRLILYSTAVPGGRPAALVRAALNAAVLAIAVWAVAPTESRADNANGTATPSGTVECGRHRLFDTADDALEAGGHGLSPASIDGKIAADLPIWKTIALGAPGGPRALRAALDTRCRVGGLAGEMLDSPAFTTSKTRSELDLVVVSAAALGFGAEAVPRAAVYERAAQLGLQLCPAEVGPQLRVQYPDQPPGEFLHVAMHPIVTPHGKRAAFVVGNGGGGLLLIGSDARPERIVPSTLRFVFTRPREQPVSP